MRTTFLQLLNPMKRLALLSLVGLLICSGCASRYVITLNNGSQIGSKGRPKLKNGVYVFKDLNGQQRTVPAGRVSEVSPASMAKDDSSQFFKPSK